MTLYVDSIALIKYRKKIKTLTSAYPNLKIIIFVNRMMHKNLAYRIVRQKLNALPFFVVDISHLFKNDIKLYNKDRLYFVIIVRNKLSQAQKKKIAIFKKNIIIKDTSADESNYLFYKTCNNLVYKTDFGENISEAIAFDFSAFNYTDYACNYSSCMGKTIYINKAGNLYFCPFHQEESYLCKIADVSKLEQTLKQKCFISTLDKIIERRKSCKNSSCKIYEKCNGGCPFDSINCEQLKTRISKAEQLREQIKQSNVPLDAIPLYQCESIQKEICGFPQDR